MTTCRSFLFATLLAAALPLGAQDQATSLAEGCRRAAVVVRATVLAASDPSPEWHRLEFATTEALRGAAGERFTLQEPSGACCGRALFALQPGQSVLLFLQRTGPVLHPFGGSRGVLEDDPAVVAHVRALLAAGDDAARRRVLLLALGAEAPRVAADAAHALAALPDLPLDAGQRAAVAAAFATALDRQPTTAASLAEVVVRSHDGATVDALLALQLGPRPPAGELLGRTLARCRAELLVERLPAHLGPDPDAQVRAAELLAALPGDTARSPLLRLLRQAAHPRAQLAAVEPLLGLGVPAQQLRGQVPAPVLDLAARRVRHGGRFRAIAPDRR